MDQLLLYRKIYDLILWFLPHINRLPKFYKQVLGKCLFEVSLRLLVLTIKANKLRGSSRLQSQMEISNELDTLRILTRMTKDLKLISIKQYIYAEEKINEIGKMLQGWISYSS